MFSAPSSGKAKYSIEQAREIFLGEKLELLENKYVNAHFRMRYVCRVCQVLDKKPLYTVIAGHGCRTCGDRIKAAARRTSIAEVREVFEASGLILLEDRLQE